MTSTVACNQQQHLQQAIKQQQLLYQAISNQKQELQQTQLGCNNYCRKQLATAFAAIGNY